MIEIYKYARKPFVVDAIQVTAENMADVAHWCDGKVQGVKDSGVESAVGTSFIKVRVKRPLTIRQTKAFVGDWVLAAGASFKVYTPGAFEKSFDLVPSTDPLDFVDQASAVKLVEAVFAAKAEAEENEWDQATSEMVEVQAEDLLAEYTKEK